MSRPLRIEFADALYDVTSRSDGQNAVNLTKCSPVYSASKLLDVFFPGLAISIALVYSETLRINIFVLPLADFKLMFVVLHDFTAIVVITLSCLIQD